ncbi:ferrochelatase [Helicobacter heilmannii]|uniref:Ferrochelatase n=1 Tax=Helicobacter heilmannii TaxID=35817 RepID=A0A0K2Y4R0_HELHE|nr:ferrochelatase [Helicobacter heilmannii]BDQ27655.1 ferrochelatase [Helicobacter heilmannii]CCM11653.1 Ferrochelatase, protoheme ferro-lyase [Helicobacter heilmannii ASB1.4]CRI33793.1 Ferrochelatase, protoheme ferro-lyase [Helicobacter heilmannii]
MSVLESKEAVVLLNMGGPNNLYEVEVFLTNMFNDPYILAIKSPFWRKFLASFIVKMRKEKSKAIYEKIEQKSPINDLSTKLTQRLNALDPTRHYTYAMRYTPPFASMVFAELQRQGFNSCLLFSMYPQYSTTTTLSSIEDSLNALKTLNFTPHLSCIDRFYTHAPYNQAVVESITNTIKGHNPKEFVLIFSVHGLPESVVKQGDPYQAECLHHVSLLKQQLLPLHFKKITLSYQSKVGPMKWLEPSTEQTIEAHRKDKILIYPLAFSIDNSETIYELQIQYRLEAMRLAVPEFLVCPCLNDNLNFAQAILDLVHNAPRKPL